MDKDPAVMHTGQATADPARDGPLVPDLVTRARTGDKQAWDALVERYAPLIWSICCKYRLGHADAQDVGQSVWLRLLDQLDKIRDPAALPGGSPSPPGGSADGSLTQHAELAAPVYALDAREPPGRAGRPADQELLAAERHAALARRSPACRRTASN